VVKRAMHNHHMKKHLIADWEFVDELKKQS